VKLTLGRSLLPRSRYSGQRFDEDLRDLQPKTFLPNPDLAAVAPISNSILEMAPLCLFCEGSYVRQGSPQRRRFLGFVLACEEVKMRNFSSLAMACDHVVDGLIVALK
jgi:hypothetical protein